MGRPIRKSNDPSSVIDFDELRHIQEKINTQQGIYKAIHEIEAIILVLMDFGCINTESSLSTESHPLAHTAIYHETDQKD